MRVYAIHLGKKLSLREVERRMRPASRSRDPLVFAYARRRYLACLKFGVVIFWGFSEKERRQLLRILYHAVTDRFEEPLEDDMRVRIGGGRNMVKEGTLHLSELSYEKIAVASLILGRSVALEHYEQEVENVSAEFDEVMSSFAERGKTKLSTRALLRKLGFAMRVRQATMRRMALLDKPDVTWDDSELDALYEALTEEYELDERFEVLEHKLKTIFWNVEFVLSFLNERRTIILEAIIVLLIVIEIAIFIYEVFWL